jgi:hypothetical protein
MNKVKSDSVILSADVRKCFDRINHSSLHEVIRKWPLPKGCITWARSSLVSEIYDVTSKQSHRKEVGTPQGGILSPLLCNEVLDKIDKLGIDLYDRYADNILFDAKHKVEIVEELEKLGMEFKEEMIERLSIGKSIIHLGCELSMYIAAKKLTVWFKFPTRKTVMQKEWEICEKFRICLPSLDISDPRITNISSYWFQKSKQPKKIGSSLMASQAVGFLGKMNHVELPTISPFDKQEGGALTWCGLSSYHEKTWLASRSDWTINPTSNNLLGNQKVSEMDRIVIDKLYEKTTSSRALKLRKTS